MDYSIYNAVINAFTKLNTFRENFFDTYEVKVDGEIVNKTRSSIEPQIYPTAKIIGDLSITSGKGTGNNDGITISLIAAFVKRSTSLP